MNTDVGERQQNIQLTRVPAAGRAQPDLHISASPDLRLYLPKEPAGPVLVSDLTVQIPPDASVTVRHAERGIDLQSFPTELTLGDLDAGPARLTIHLHKPGIVPATTTVLAWGDVLVWRASPALSLPDVGASGVAACMWRRPDGARLIALRASGRIGLRWEGRWGTHHQAEQILVRIPDACFGRLYVPTTGAASQHDLGDAEAGAPPLWFPYPDGPPSGPLQIRFFSEARKTLEACVDVSLLRVTPAAPETPPEPLAPETPAPTTLPPANPAPLEPIRLPTDVDEQATEVLGASLPPEVQSPATWKFSGEVVHPSAPEDPTTAVQPAADPEPTLVPPESPLEPAPDAADTARLAALLVAQQARSDEQSNRLTALTAQLARQEARLTALEASREPNPANALLLSQLDQLIAQLSARRPEPDDPASLQALSEALQQLCLHLAHAEPAMVTDAEQLSRAAAAAARGDAPFQGARKLLEAGEAAAAVASMRSRLKEGGAAALTLERLSARLQHLVGAIWPLSTFEALRPDIASTLWTVGLELIEPTLGASWRPWEQDVLDRRDGPADTVLEVHRPGFRRGGKVAVKAEVTLGETATAEHH